MQGDNLERSITGIAEKGEISNVDLEALWERLPPSADPAAFLVFTEVFRGQFAENQPEALKFRPGGWIVKASGAAIQSALVTAFLSVALAANHATGIAIAVLSAVIPLLFAVEKARLSASDSVVLAELTLRQEIREKSAADIYKALPESIQDQIQPLAFEDFLARCQLSGNAARHDHPESILASTTYELRPPGSESFRVTFL